jgi:hypothetical protein
MLGARGVERAVNFQFQGLFTRKFVVERLSGAESLVASGGARYSNTRRGTWSLDW